MVGRGGGAKIIKNCRTSFMNVPHTKQQVSYEIPICVTQMLTIQNPNLYVYCYVFFVTKQTSIKKLIFVMDFSTG